MNARGLMAIGILAAWGAGIAAFAQREISRSPREKLAEIAARVAPGATYFAVERAGAHVGFASNTIDTIPGGLLVTWPWPVPAKPSFRSTGTGSGQ